MLRRVTAMALLFLVSSPAWADDKAQKTKPAQTTAELQQQIEKLLRDTHTPGVSLAIVHKYGPEYIAGLGMADVASKRAANETTLFRIGSTSKAFASLSILLLADQGKLSLDDPVHKLAPEVWFKNRWESQDPVRVVHLLEHTTGWDDMHLREYAKEWPADMGLRQALDYDHSSRTSRWRPGTRMAYCNSGPPVAAYIVEKVSGQRFEDFVQDHLFNLIGMKTATYFPPPPGTATTLYHNDGKTPFPYWNIIFRPAGSINASALDMAAYVQFYLNRGVVGNVQVVPEADILRMENPRSTWAAREGMKPGYGLSNYWSFHQGFAWHGHNGGVNGGLTEMAYMPEYGVGYFFSINSGNADASDKIGKAIRGYIIHSLQKPAVVPAAALPANYTDYAGWYEPDSPRVEMTHFIDRLAGLTRVKFADGKLLMSNLQGQQTFIPVGGAQFRYVAKDDDPEPVATTALLKPNHEGLFIQAGAGTTLRHISSWLAIPQIALIGFVLLCMIAILLYAPFWIIGGLAFPKRRRPSERAMRTWPLLSVLCLTAFVVTVTAASDDIIARLGNFTPWSVAIFALTLAFGFASMASFVSLGRARPENVRRVVRGFSIVVTTGLLTATLYFAWWGVIGWRTWA